MDTKAYARAVLFWLGAFLAAVLFVGASVGFWAASAWDRRPAGWPAIETKILWFPIRLAAPDSLSATRYAQGRADQVNADAADLGQCRANVDTLSGALAAQNAAVLHLKADSDARLAQAQQAARDAQASRRRALAEAAAIQAAPETGNACAAAERLIRETIR